MHVIIRIATRFIALTAVAAILVLSGGSGQSVTPHTQLVKNPPSCC